jgi:hypothetical protein
MTSAVDDVMLFRESYRQREVNAMALRHSKYDGDLQMFVEPSREPDLTRLTFLRWLVERRRLEHGPAGAPCGDLATSSGHSVLGTAELKAA